MAGQFPLLTEPYVSQNQRWPQTGRHILAQFDEHSVIVYQAYNRAIGRFAVSHGYFGGSGFGFERMSWIKPNFLWMMYRCGWGTKPNQETILAVRLRRPAFDTILRLAVHSSFVPDIYGTEPEWKAAIQASQVRLQWDPDHHPAGEALERRAIQLGLRGPILAQYARDWIVKIEDVTEFVHEQHRHVLEHAYDKLLVPHEDVYPVADADTAARLGVSGEHSNG